MAATLIRGAAAPRFGHDGVEVTGYAAPSRGSATVSAWRLRLAPGAASPWHQLSHDEAFIALRGEALVELGGEPLRLREGDGLSVPPDTPFRISNPGPQPFEAIACMAAGGTARLADGVPFVPPWAA